MAADVTEVLASFSAYAEPRDGLGDNPFKLGCSLSAPATDEEVRSAWPAGPQGELAEAWSVSRESRLFEDVDYGQWGLVLLSPAASAERTAEQRALRPDDYRDEDVVVGEFLGDPELLVLAPSEAGDRQVLVALPLDGRQDWYPGAPDLARFLEKYRDQQGAKFWESAG
ncbi:MAG TPA: hypothetical protein VMV92_28840 [Streptosporangiaceae bacterium]|nr:hypothetical protein [Streptosporangiaceae bacterium]